MQMKIWCAKGKYKLLKVVSSKKKIGIEGFMVYSGAPPSHRS